MSTRLRIVEAAADMDDLFSQMVDRLSGSMGKLGAKRNDVLEAVARIQVAQHAAFHQSCASLNYDEAEMIRRDLRGANNPMLAMFVLRAIERPRGMREAVGILAQMVGCRLVVNEAPTVRLTDAKADLQIAHAQLQATMDRALVDGHLDDEEKRDIRTQILELTERVARVNKSVVEER
jgi:hypothetical protein